MYTSDCSFAWWTAVSSRACAWRGGRAGDKRRPEVRAVAGLRSWRQDMDACTRRVSLHRKWLTTRVAPRSDWTKSHAPDSFNKWYDYLLQKSFVFSAAAFALAHAQAQMRMRSSCGRLFSADSFYDVNACRDGCWDNCIVSPNRESVHMWSLGGKDDGELSTSCKRNTWSRAWNFSQQMVLPVIH